MTISQQRLKELLSYSPVVGVFEWRVHGHRIRPGYLAGGPTGDGYVGVTINRKRYPAHHLAWLYMTGSMPKGQIDHIDGDKSNNAFSNLREVSPSQNLCNAKRNQANTSGVKGVSFNKKTNRWTARIRRSDKVVFWGEFETLHEASRRIAEAREKLHGEYANHGVHAYLAEELDGE